MKRKTAAAAAPTSDMNYHNKKSTTINNKNKITQTTLRERERKHNQINEEKKMSHTQLMQIIKFVVENSKIETVLFKSSMCIPNVCMCGHCSGCTLE